MTFYLSLALIIAGWIIRAVMLVVVLRSKWKGAVAAWLLIIFFLPWVGLFLYLLIGTHRLPRRRIERHAKLLGEFSRLRKSITPHRHLPRPDIDPGQQTTVDLAERLTGMPGLGGNAVELLTGDTGMTDRLIDDIDAAERSVHLLFYIFADDDTGRRVADALARAVVRGVVCRVLVDAVGSSGMLKTRAPAMRRDGIAVSACLPVNLLRFYMSRIDVRNHRKLAVIDGLFAYTGSWNIVDAGYGRSDIAWHDLVLRLTGPVVLELQAVFLADWYHETGMLMEDASLFPESPTEGDIPVQALPSGPNYPTGNYQLLAVDAVFAARERITITTPYFVPDSAFMEALRTAALRGLRVELILSARMDQVVVGYASRAYYDELLDAGVVIYHYRENLLHTKSITIDDSLALFGTSNLDIRSFRLNFELNLVLYGSGITCRIREAQNGYLRHSDVLDPAEWARRSTSRRVLEGIARLFSPLL
jgi:cardiolipin synthase A/B